MSNRCPNCEHFVSLEASEDETFNTDPVIDETGSIAAEFRLVVNCAECGEEMKESAVEFDIEPTEEIQAHLDEHMQVAVKEANEVARRGFIAANGLDESKPLSAEQQSECMDIAALETEDPSHEFEVECTSVSVGERHSGTGKTPMRFRKKFYVVELELHVTCSTHEDWEGCTVTATEEVQAAWLEDLN